MSRDNSIVVEGLVREFKKGPRAVDGIDLRVEPGEIYGFLGPNGAGKSTTVHMLTTLLPPTAGTARVAGYDVVADGPKVRASIGAALQEAALDPLLTGRDHLRLQTMLQGLPRPSVRRQRTDELLERVGLTEAADRKVGGYSGGMKRRLDLALALVHRPRVLFLDEPTTGLDPQSRTALWEDVAPPRTEDGVTVFLTTQYLEEADVLADRVGIIDNGRIVAEGTPTELKAEIGRASVHAIAAKDRGPGAPRRAPRAVRSAASATARRRSPSASTEGVSLADIVRALDADGIGWTTSSCVPRASTTSSSPRPAGRSKARRRRGRRRSRCAARPAVAGDESRRDPDRRRRRRSIRRTLRQPAMAIPPLVFPIVLLLVNSAASSRRPSSRASRPTRSSRSRSRSRSSRERSSRRWARAPTSRATSRPGS